jgi:hypothetical protein
LRATLIMIKVYTVSDQQSKAVCEPFHKPVRRPAAAGATS